MHKQANIKADMIDALLPTKYTDFVDMPLEELQQYVQNKKWHDNLLRSAVGGAVAGGGVGMALGGGAGYGVNALQSAIAAPVTDLATRGSVLGSVIGGVSAPLYTLLQNNSHRSQADKVLTQRLLKESSMHSYPYIDSRTLFDRATKYASYIKYAEEEESQETDKEKEKKDKHEKGRPRVAKGDLLSRGMASTVGRANPMSWLPVLGMSPRMMSSPTYKGRDKVHKAIVDAMYDAAPERLAGTKVNLGGARLGELLYRGLTTDKTSPIGKVLSVPNTLGSYLMGSLSRSDHYAPLSDTVNLINDDPGVLTHELGHAIDFNDWVSKKPYKGVLGRIGREISNIPKDLYALSRVLPPMMLGQESLANTKSEEVLNKAKMDAQAKDRLFNLRQRALPAGLGSYIGGTVLPIGVGIPGGPGVNLGGIAGMIAGRTYGGLQAGRDKDYGWTGYNKLTSELREALGAETDLELAKKEREAARMQQLLEEGPTGDPQPQLAFT